VARTAAENEASIQAFRRERLAEGVQVAQVTLRRTESSLLHSHTTTRDTFYIVAGCLTLTLYEDANSPAPSFHALSATPPQEREANEAKRTRVLRFRLHPGDVFIIEPGVVHCAANLDDEPCSFLCIEGVGAYDFVLAEGH